MSPVERELRRQQRRLRQLERNAEAELAAEYRRLYALIKRDLDELLRLIEQAENPKTSWLVKQWQYHRLLDGIEHETTRFAFVATEIVTRHQGLAVQAVPENTFATITAGLTPAQVATVASVTATFGGLPAGAYERIVGNASNGRPLSNLLYKIAPQAKRDAARVLTDGLAKGQNPREVARAFRKVTGVTKTRAETIARTEMLRAYREATQEAYKASRAVTGWYWKAELDNRTCFACAMMSGTVHTNNETLDGHINCRCTQVPKTLTWEELGFTGIPDTGYRPPSGEKWFDALTDQQKRDMLGPGKLEALKSGEVTKKDLIARPRSKEWGTMRRNASLKEARRKASARAA